MLKYLLFSPKVPNYNEMAPIPPLQNSKKQFFETEYHTQEIFLNGPIMSSEQCNAVQSPSKFNGIVPEK